MAGSPRKRARRAGNDPERDLASRSAAARRAAELAASRALTAWWKAEREKLRTDPTLTEAELSAAERALLLEFGRRSKRAIAKAKRDSRPGRLLEADARAEIERQRRQA